LLAVEGRLQPPTDDVAETSHRRGGGEVD